MPRQICDGPVNFSMFSSFGETILTDKNWLPSSFFFSNGGLSPAVRASIYYSVRRFIFIFFLFLRQIQPNNIGGPRNFRHFIYLWHQDASTWKQVCIPCITVSRPPSACCLRVVVVSNEAEGKVVTARSPKCLLLKKRYCFLAILLSLRKPKSRNTWHTEC